MQPERAELPRRSYVGTGSLLVAVGGAAASQAAMMTGAFGHPTWLRVLAAGFEAATVGGVADWFAVTAIFRHPLGLPFPHTWWVPLPRLGSWP